MVSFLLWPLALLGAVFWVALPAGVLLMAIFYRGAGSIDSSAIHQCRGYDPTNPAVKPCWANAGEDYCPLHAGATGNAPNA